MFIDADPKAKLDALPDEDVRQVVDNRIPRLSAPKRSFAEVIASIKRRSNSLPHGDYRVVETIEDGREERWERP